MGRTLHRNVLILLLFILSGMSEATAYSFPAHQLIQYKSFTNYFNPGDTITTSTGGTVICGTNLVTLTASAGATGTTYQWYGNNFLIPGATAITYMPQFPGTYYVIATYLGVQDTYPSVILTGSIPPTVSYTYSSSSICGNTPINYVSTASGTGLTYQWDFGDGSTGSTLPDPSHTFIAANGGGTQIFTVKLTVTNSDGCSTTNAQPVTINLPSAALGGNNTLVSYNGDGKTYFRSCSNSDFNFTFVNQSTSTNSHYYIDWGDGSAAYSSATFSSSLNHTYSQGTWQITYIVTAISGCIDTAYYYPFVGANPAIGFVTPGNTSICTGNDLTFSTTGFASNPPGTLYTVTFSDGTAPIVYNVPPPATITHTFNKSSCGTTSGGYSNAFSATITASNPCSASTATVSPIYVSQSASASFSLGVDTGCVGTPVTFTSNNLPTNSVSSAGCIAGKQVWKISPATGWTISTGSTGNDFGQTDPSFWTTGTANIGVTFTTPGTYTLQLETGNNTCGTATATQTICVNAVPTSTFTIDKTTGCNPLTVQTTNNSALPFCGSNHYQWSVNYTNTGCLPNTGAFTYTNGTSAVSANPQFQFTSPGVYTITLLTTSPGGTCSTTSASKTVTVKDKPIVSALAGFNATICRFGSITPSTPTVTNCYSATTATYLWTVTGGTPGNTTLLTTSNPGTITYNTAGNYTVQLDVTNECGTTTVTKSLTVTDAPVVTVPANQMFCNGLATGALTFSSSLPSTTYSWTNTNTNIGLAASGTGNINSFTAKNTGSSPITATITVTPNNGCPGLPVPFTITVNPTPNTPTVTTLFTYCLNDVAAQLTATAAAGNTLTWYAPGTTFTHTGPSATAPTPSTAVAGSTKYWVTQTNATGCESAGTSITVTVNPLIANNNIGSSQTLCAASSAATLQQSGTALSGGSGTYSYQWQSSPDGTTFINIPGATAATYSPGTMTATTQYQRIVTSGTCSSTSNIVIITVQPTLASYDISASQTICTGDTPASLTGQTPAGGSGVYTFQWQSSANGTTFTDIATATGSNYQPSALSATTYYRRNTFSGTCNGTSSVVIITVNPKPTVNAVADKNYCNNVLEPAITFTSTPNTNTTFTWTNDNTAIGLAASGTGNLPAFTTTNATKSPITANISVTPTYTNVVSCPGNTLTFKINILPTITLSAINNQTVCAGTVVPAVVPVNDADAFPGSLVSYVWVVTGNPIGLSSGLGAQVPAFTAVNNGSTNLTATITVTPQYQYNSQTCSGTATMYTITVNPKPTTAAAGSNAQTCNTSYTLNGNTPTAGVGTWTTTVGPPVTFSPPSAGNSIVTGLAKGTHYQFTWTIASGVCMASSSNVTLDVLTDITNSIQSDVSSICPTQSAHLTTNVLSGGDVPGTVTASYTYLWESSPNGTTGWITITGQTLANLTVSPTVTTYYRRTVSSYGLCPFVSNVISIVVNPTAPIANAGTAISVCNQTQAALNGNNPGTGFTGTWSDTAPGSTLTFSPDAHTFNATVNGLVAGNSYTLTWAIASASCGLTTSNVNVTDLLPLTNSITPAVTTICSGQSATITGVVPTGGTGAYTYTWESSTDNLSWTTISGQTGPNLTLTPTQTIYVRRNAFSGSCSLASTSVNIIVQPPIGNNVISADQQICTNTPVAALTGTTPTGGDGAYTYQWQQSSDNATWTNIALATTPNYQPANAVQVTYYRRLVSSTLCVGPQQNASNSVKISISPHAIAEYNASVLLGCIPFNLATVITPVAHNTVDAAYQWYANSVSIGTGLPFPGYTINTDGQSVTIKLVATSLFGCDADSVSQTFSTTKNITAAFTKDQIKGCGPLTVNFANTSAPIAGATYAWNFGNGQTSVKTQPDPVVFQPQAFGKDTTYYITLTATGTCNTSVYTDSVTVRSAPRAIFSPDKTVGCSPFTVNITNQSRGTPNIYTFTFGNGDQVIKTDNSAFSYTYTATKTDTVTMKMVAENECGKDSSSYQIVIYANTVQANFIVSGNNKFGCAPYTVKFDNNTTGANTFNYDFNDGTTYTSVLYPETIYHTFTQAGTYNVTMTAANGCSTAVVTQTITVLPHPPVGFTVGQLNYCVKDSAAFTNTTTSPATFSYIWNFGDGATSTSVSPKHAYAAAGTYIVTLTATQTEANGGTCQSVVTHSVTVIAAPTASFTNNASGLNCAPFTVAVSSTSANASSVSWDFGDPGSTNNTIAGTSASHQFTKAGQYKVKLIAYNSAGCLDSVSQIVRIQETPKALFSPGDTAICGTSATINLNNLTTYGGSDLVSYQWSINNVIVSNQKNLTYTFNTPTGIVLPYTFTIQLIAYSAIGCSDTIVHKMQFNPFPVAEYSAPIHINCAPFQLSLTNNSVYSDQYQWYLNGALVSTVKTPVIILGQANTVYTLKLVTSNIYGCSPSSQTQTFSTYPKPTAAFTLADSSSCDGVLNIKVTNNTVAATSYTWNFGDGSADVNTTVPTHTYGVPGTYKLRLVASNGTCTDTVIHQIQIAQPPKSVFTANLLTGCTQITPAFQNLSVNGVSYLWSFGDGTFSTVQNPTHTFDYTRSPYTITLITYGQYGCADTLVQPNYITVVVPPVVDFSAQPDSVIKIPNHTFTFKNLSTGSPVKYAWDFGDAQTSAETNPIHTFVDTGTYKVKLTATNAQGCTATRIRTVEITGVPQYLYVPNAFQPGSAKPELQTFSVRGTGMIAYSMRIYNKWGILIYQTTALDSNGSPTEGWNGYMQGEPAPQGVYVWDISATFLDGTEWKGMQYPNTSSPSKTGFIHLIR